MTTPTPDRPEQPRQPSRSQLKREAVMRGEEMPTRFDAAPAQERLGKDELDSSDPPGWYECENFYDEEVERLNCYWWDGRHLRHEPHDAIKNSEYLRNFRGPLVPASPPLSDGERETRDEERQRIAKIKRATCEGCLAAATGLPLHTVADSGYAARSYCGDAWEAGWEYINGSATWQSLEFYRGALNAEHDGADSARKGLPLDACPYGPNKADGFRDSTKTGMWQRGHDLIRLKAENASLESSLAAARAEAEEAKRVRDNALTAHAQHTADKIAIRERAEAAEAERDKLLDLLRRSLMEHGDCKSGSRYGGKPKACTACMAQLELKEIVGKWKGRTVRLA